MKSTHRLIYPSGVAKIAPLPSSEEFPFDENIRIFHEAQQYNSLLEVVYFPQEEFDQDGGSLVKKITNDT